MEKKQDKRKIESADQAFKLIDILIENKGDMTVSEVADKSERSIGSVHTYLNTLKDIGIISKNKNSYQLGPKLVTIGAASLHNFDIYRASRDEINLLARETGETVHLVTRYDRNIISLFEQSGNRAREADRHERKRERLQHFHCTAAGKAYLAHLPDDGINDIISEGLPQLTPNTITEPEKILRQLEEIRNVNYSTNMEEQVIGMRAVGTPIRDQTGSPVGAISISAPRNRIKGEKLNLELPNQIQDAASTIEMNYALS